MCHNAVYGQPESNNPTDLAKIFTGKSGRSYTPTHSLPVRSRPDLT